MKKLLLLLGTALMLSFAGCESFGGDDVVGGSYSIGGAIQKGPFVQGSNITIQPLNSKLKPIGQMYTTQTTNDAGMFEMDGVNSKYAEIIATGYYFDEVEGKISSATLTLRSIADLKDGTQTNVNLLTSLTYNRIKNLVTNEGKSISEAQEQAEKELYTALGIPSELQPSVGCGAMNIAKNGEGDGLLLVISAILQEGRTTGELTEYISKFSTDLADDGMVENALVEKFNLDGQHLLRFEGRIKDNLKARYESLGIECNVPEFSQYLSYLGKPSEHYIIPFTYYEDKNEVLHDNPDWAIDFAGGIEMKGIEEGFVFSSDVEYIGYDYKGGYGEIYLSAAPTVINRCYCTVLRAIDIPDGVTTIGEYAFDNDFCLEKLGIPDSVDEIGDCAFFLCMNLKNIVIPPKVTTINRGTFYNCRSIESITIPDNVTTISTYAFESCTSLAEFRGKFASDDGRCLIVDGVLRAFAPADLTEYTIPHGVTSIGEYAFSGCSSLENVNIPEGVTSIGKSAFTLCSGLVSVTIPSSITSIGELAFCTCRKLVEVYCKSTTPPVATLGEYQWGAFDTTADGLEIYVPTESVWAYKVADGWSKYANRIVGYDFE